MVSIMHPILLVGSFFRQGGLDAFLSWYGVKFHMFACFWPLRPLHSAPAAVLYLSCHKSFCLCLQRGSYKGLIGSIWRLSHSKIGFRARKQAGARDCEANAPRRRIEPRLESIPVPIIAPIIPPFSIKPPYNDPPWADQGQDC